MLDEIGTIRRQFTAHETLDGRIDQVFEAMKQLGFEALIYDYTPVPYDLDGAIMIPSLLKLRNISDDMHEYWCNRGYFRIDPVQQVALRTSAPFFWNYDTDADTLINRFMSEDTAPVARYLSERDMSTGVTVPVHMPRGDYATVTGIRFGGKQGFRAARAALYRRLQPARPCLPRNRLFALRYGGAQRRHDPADRAGARMPAPFGGRLFRQGNLPHHRPLGADRRHASQRRGQETRRQEPHPGGGARHPLPPARRPAASYNL